MYVIRLVALTFSTSVVLTVTARHVIPCELVPDTQSVHTVLVVHIVGLAWDPVREVALYSAAPVECPLNISVVKPDPGLLPVMTMLNVHVLLLAPDGHQV